MKLNTLNLGQLWIKASINAGGLCIDATAGRGYDTAFLCEQVGKQGKVIAFDIQEEAIKSTRELLTQKGYIERANLILDSHENMERYVAPESVDVVMFNLGYLPGGNHQIATNVESSQAAIEAALRVLKRNGTISLCIYQGGDTGFEERDGLISYLKQLDARGYHVIMSEFVNKPNFPPILVLIQKVC